MMHSILLSRRNEVSRQTPTSRRSGGIILVSLLFLLLATTTTTTAQQRCGCATCDATVLGNNANGKNCSVRIDERMERGFSEAEACQFAAERYPLACNPGW